jgi:hypothetical protein
MAEYQVQTFPEQASSKKEQNKKLFPNLITISKTMAIKPRPLFPQNSDKLHLFQPQHRRLYLLFKFHFLLLDSKRN